LEVDEGTGDFNEFFFGGGDLVVSLFFFFFFGGADFVFLDLLYPSFLNPNLVTLIYEFVHEWEYMNSYNRESV
jgi:hypothetical protein